MKSPECKCNPAIPITPRKLVPKTNKSVSVKYNQNGTNFQNHFRERVIYLHPTVGVNFVLLCKESRMRTHC